MRLSAWDGENAAPSAKDIATATTGAMWQHQRAASKISKFPEIVKGTSTRRLLNATAVMNRTLPKDATGMFVSGTSTHKVGEVAQTLLGVAPSASAISRLNQTLTQQFEAWRERPLEEHWRIVYLDGVHFSIRHGEKADSTIILTALGVDLAGNKAVLALRACAEEDQDGWACLLHDLRSPGATHIDLFVYHLVRSRPSLSGGSEHHCDIGDRRRNRGDDSTDT